MNEVDQLAKIIWDYMLMRQELKKADAIIVLGSHNVQVAKWAAELYHKGYAPVVLFTGNEGVGRKVSGFNGTPEAEKFAEEALKMGVPQSAILIENKATNTGENIIFSHKLLASKNIHPNTIVAVQKPYMERRTYATLKAQWPSPQPKFIVSSQPITYEQYISDPLYPKEYTINVMVGDLQRIREYPKKGYQIEQHIPEHVWDAYEQLMRLGYDKHVL